ncbi:O-antigen ligase family protein [Chthonobacter rhizosphaerae]|uniref:O-antigen ligase family protein n=1 Tax=Chthonobacter rhizosphaerae TaxID=2735553 RepID=UPI0015EEFD1E|nr:O-antigen ligase [Chthonobacter rhizosphaerae]
MRLNVDVVAHSSRNAIYAYGALALTVYAFSYSIVFGSGILVAVLVAWFLPAVLKPRAIRIAILDLVILMLPILALVSTLWSEHPDATLRGSLQYLTTALCATIAAQIVSPGNMARGLMLGCIATVVHSLIYDVTVVAPDMVDDYRLTGLFGSPNQLGLIASLGVLSAVALNAAYRQPFTWKLVSAATAAVCGYALVLTESVTSMIALAVALATTALIFFIRRRSYGFRVMFMPWAVAAAGAAVALLATMLPAINVYELVGRDETVSGRTELWAVGWDVFLQHSGLGTGFQAFWVIGSPEAERLWDAFNIPDRTGFHLHNLFVQVMVDLGTVGLLALLVTIGTLVLRLATPLFARRIHRRVLLYIPLVAYFLVRTTSEIDFFGQFAAGTFLMYFVAAQSARQPVRRSHSRRRGPVLNENPFEGPLVQMPAFLSRKSRRKSIRQGSRPHSGRLSRTSANPATSPTMNEMWKENDESGHGDGITSSTSKPEPA